MVTIALVGGSYSLGALRIGLLVLLLHDSSDIIADLVKMANYMGFDSKSGLFLTEIFFVSNLASWLYLRMYVARSRLALSRYSTYSRLLLYSFPSHFSTCLFCQRYLFPFHVIATVYRDADPMFHTKADGVGYSWGSSVGIWICCALLCVLACMHIYWFCLFMRIAIRLLKAGEETHDAAKEEYEGESGNATSDTDEQQEGGGNGQKPITRKKAKKPTKKTD